MNSTIAYRRLPAFLAAGLLLVPTTGAFTAFTPHALAAEQACTQAVGGMRAFTDGHQDMLLRADGVVLDYEHRETFNSGEFLFEVPDSARSATGWVLPQTQVAGLPWPGFSTTGLSYGAEISLASFSGPGQMTAYQGDLFGATTRLDSADTSVTWDLPANTHAHTAFLFTEAGAYEVTFRFSTSGNGTHDISTIFLVGSTAIAESATGTVTVSCDPTSGGGGAPQGPVEQLTADLTGVTKEVSKLDRAMGGFLDSVKKEITPSTAPSSPTPPKPATAPTSRPVPTPPQARPQVPAPPAAPAAAAPAPRSATSTPAPTSAPAPAPLAAAHPSPDITQVNATAPFVGVLSGTAWGLGLTALVGGIALFASAFRMRSRVPHEEQLD